MRAIRRIREYMPLKAYFFLVTTILAIAAVACYDFSPTVHLVVAGDIATADLLADRSIQYEDVQETNRHKEEVRKNQPLVCDLVLDPLSHLRNTLQDLLIGLNRAETLDDREAMRVQIARLTGLDISELGLNVLSDGASQDLINETLMPYLQHQFSKGVLSEMRLALPYKGGIIIHNIISGEETLHPEIDTVADLKSEEAALSQKLASLPVSPNSRRVLGLVLSALMQPTLVPNYKATEERAAVVVQAVAPVMYRIERGEIIVRQGEKVTHQQQIRAQTLWNKKADHFDVSRFFGIAFCGILLSSGLLFSPSGRPSSPVSPRDFAFIACLLILFVFMSKGIYLLGEQFAQNSPTFVARSIAFAVPVTGAASLSSLVFSTRRYLATGLLLAFFCTMMIDGEIGHFIFYFASAMWGTWVTSRTQSRQDVIWSFIPICLGLFVMWLSTTLLISGMHAHFLSEIGCVTAGIISSVILTVALAPVIEMVFGYTTRFRLMELLNMEQPLLRELMLNAPGTYHHSLIVSNMVEAGAEAVGAHGLLCKVAALYHDVGKVSKANYFIENQFIDDNPHDKLTPSMSALILVSHVKHGTELAEQHRLGKEVVDIIRQHHGNGLIRYFYQKALQQADGLPPSMADFSYPGPKPQSKEAAIVMLADVIEASSRTLHDPAPAKLRQHIDNTIKSIHSTGQLDESELTFRDLDALAESFQKILRGIFHHRIAYPDKIQKGRSPVPPTAEQLAHGVRAKQMRTKPGPVLAAPAKE